MIDLSTWLTNPEAAARMGISERTLDRRCAAGEGPERRNRPRPGLKPEVVNNPDDVERLATPKPHVMPDPDLPADWGSLVPRPQTTAVAPRPSSADVLPALLDRVAGAVEWWLAETRPAPLALYLTLPQASAYTGLSVAFLRRLIRTGKLPVIRDRSLKARRLDLDNLVNADPALSGLSKCGGAPAAPADPPAVDEP